MGNREDLLAGAKLCLLEKGYARTTARDIATAAGTSLAAIGYHFGSKEVLLTQAMTESTGVSVGDTLEAAMRASVGPDPQQEFADTWDRLRLVFSENPAMLTASLEGLSQADRMPAVREAMVSASTQAINEIEAIYAELHPKLSAQRVAAVARLYYTLLNGLSIEWQIDPDSPPTGEQLGLAIGTIAGQD